jgi:citrate synthase
MSVSAQKAAAVPVWPGSQFESPAVLEMGSEKIELPVVVGTEGERAIDIGKLRSRTGLITLDEGYVNTGSTASAITFLDGEKGVLRYRGYAIEELAERCDFLAHFWRTPHQ